MSTPPAVRSDIQALRALAVGVVVLFHLDVAWFRGGFIGVDVFFVISGYLVLGSELKKLIVVDTVAAAAEAGASNAASSATAAAATTTAAAAAAPVVAAEPPPSPAHWFLLFLTRRVQRLTPAATVCLLFVVALLACAPSPIDDWANVRAAALHYVNVHFYVGLQSYWQRDASRSFVLHFWSLALEEQFYVVVGAAIVAVKLVFGRDAAFRRPTVVRVTAALLVLTLVPLPLGSSDARFFLLPFRMWEFVAGALASLLGELPIPATLAVRSCRLERPLRASLFAALVAVLLLCSVLMPRQNWPHAGACGVVVVTMLALCCRVDVPLRLPVLVGDWSYSIYLYHWPLIAWSLLLPPPTSSAAALFRNTALLCMALACALASFAYVENETRALWRRNWPVWMSIVVVASCAVALATVVVPALVHPTTHAAPPSVDALSHANESAPNASLVSAAMQSAMFSIAHDPPPLFATYSLKDVSWEGLLHRGDGPTWHFPPVERHGDRSTCFVLFGDSHSRRLVTAVSELAAQIDNATVVNAAPMQLCSHHVPSGPMPKALAGCGSVVIVAAQLLNCLPWLRRISRGKAASDMEPAAAVADDFARLLTITLRYWSAVGHVVLVQDNPSGWATPPAIDFGATANASRPMHECTLGVEDLIDLRFFPNVSVCVTEHYFCGGRWEPIVRGQLPDERSDDEMVAPGVMRPMPTWRMCHARVNGKPMFEDANHLSPEWLANYSVPLRRQLHAIVSKHLAAASAAR